MATCASQNLKLFGLVNKEAKFPKLSCILIALLNFKKLQTYEEFF